MALSRTESLYSLSRITPGSLKMPSYLWPRQYLDVTEGRALCSVIVRLRLQCFFLVLPEKAVVRLCEAEDSGGPLLGRLMVVGKKCTANLDLTNGFRMAVNAHPRALQTIAAE
ncbi:histidine triad nucleotide-binding protein 1-like isoform X2 [Oxyura jamaicensis]|uniref:histidine triad nucleotide-binding protein 1-like isoform X2 n=1 Tax=Oxyura jamaicensis TaxID=8884 RepID=UPI0015A6BCAF|nr:histidine triad nucleotide-binding protein 1-like isoform X2 [Oxyura jamaicensis]